jgi:hypothetical protein
MKATVTHPFKGCRDGELHPVSFKPGDTVTGELARAMVRDGKAKSVTAAPQNKDLGQAPADKFRSADVDGGDSRSRRKRSKSKQG